MIPEAEVKETARRLGVDPMFVDHDHALGVALFALAASRAADDPAWVFKGGTCLRKCYVPGYRFSEDLDFTVIGSTAEQTVRERMLRLVDPAEGVGVRLLIDQVRVRAPGASDRGATLEVRLPYRGVISRTGSPANIRLHLSTGEPIVFQQQERALLHGYTDAAQVACSLPCYSLEEMLSEKLRSLCGQRINAVARDLYDVARLVELGADADAALAALPEKAASTGLDLIDSGRRFEERRAEFAHSWSATLDHLIGATASMTFEAAWEVAAGLVHRV
jgi:predicted nucleotidyltransferase component of viral defense system